MKPNLRPLGGLSLRYKIPLRVTALVVLVAVAVTVAIVARQAQQTREDLDAYSVSLARALANTMRSYLRHDDVWRAYEIVVAAAADAGAPSVSATPVIVTDAEGRVFVSSRPREFPVGARLADLGPDFAAFAGTRGSDGAERTVAAAGDRLFYAAPVVVDGVRIGEVVLIASTAALWPRYMEIFRQATIVTVLTLLILLPASWFWARRTAVPLIALAGAMSKVPAKLDDIGTEALPDTGDEIGHLTRAFRDMLQELKRKRELEERVIASERLAAIGRLAAGMAHEINNPLGGMLNAISTYRRHGGGDDLALRTLALLERGLTQIRGLVGALLVETRDSDRPIGPEDIGDVLLLVAPEIERKGGHLVRHVMLDVPRPLPARQVRQVLLNLLLNAAHAIERGGCVRVEVAERNDFLAIRVQNDGRHISEDKLQYLFEPFALAGAEGSGLGLWIVYQIVQQLRGDLTVESRPGLTLFAVDLPLSAATERPRSKDERSPAVVSD
jgi:signal transduction histidine kinase